MWGNTKSLVLTISRVSLFQILGKGTVMFITISQKTNTIVRSWHAMIRVRPRLCITKELSLMASRLQSDWLMKLDGAILKNSFFHSSLLSSPMPRNASSLISLPSSTPAFSLLASSFLPLSSALHNESLSWLFTSIAIIATLLVVEQVVWRYKKGVLPGDAWTIPVIGKFKDSMSPSMEGYQKQWSLGDLSALSVFNMFVLLFYPDQSSDLTNLFPKFYCNGFVQ